MELGTVILSEVTQTQKDKHYVFLSSVDVSFEFSNIIFFSFEIPIDVRKFLRSHGERRSKEQG